MANTDLVPRAPASTPEKVPARIGIAPTTIDEAWRLAQMFAKSAIVPPSFRGKPEDTLVAIQLGVEIGFAPMQALQSIAVINGRASVWGDGFLALIMASPLYADHDEFYEVPVERAIDVAYIDERGAATTKKEIKIVMERREGLVAEDWKNPATSAVCTFYRRGKRMPVTRRFTVAQARKASLLSKSGPWTDYPDRMLLMRARSWAGRDTFPDLLRGIRTAEESLDSPPPIDIKPAPDVRRISETPVERPTPPPPEPPLDEPPAATCEIGPASILGIEAHAADDADPYCLITLSDGHIIESAVAAIARELEPFKGTESRFLFTCTREVVEGVEHLDLVSYVVAV